MDITCADQDSDSIYTTNQPDIVSHARYCYLNYPTVVNEIKPEKNIYNLSMDSYAEIDNSLTDAQLAIGQSSNLAQLALSYTYNFDKDSEEYKKYYDYTCILAVLAQCAIDNAKRKYAVDLASEIPMISKNMNIDTVGYPKFWQITKKDKRKAYSDEIRRKRQKDNKNKIKKKINKDLICPMNYLYDIDLNKFRNNNSTIPISDFFIKHAIDTYHKKCKKVEELIEKYMLDIYKFYVEYTDNWEEEKDLIYLFIDNFDNLIDDIKKIYISKNYAGLMSWLINRAFKISEQTRGNMESNLEKNKSLLLKILFNINPDVFLSCFEKNI